MSDFDAMMAAGLQESLDVMGRAPFTLGAATYLGLLNEFTSARELEIGGFTGLFDATLLCERPQFAAAPDATLERTLDGSQVTVRGRLFRVQKCSADETSVTLGLTHTK